MYEEYNTQKIRRIAIVVVIFLSVPIIIFLVTLIFKNNQSTTREVDINTPEIAISNLKDYQKDDEAAHASQVPSKISTVLGYNNKNLDLDSIGDIIIRDKTYKHDHNSKTGMHTVSYLIDIEKLQQSYNVSYNWSDDPKVDTSKSPYGNVTIQCPTPKQLKYGEFDCVDNIEAGTKKYNRYADRFIQRFVPFTTLLKNNITMKARERIDNDNNHYIEVTFSICDTGNYVEDAKAVLKQRASEQNLDITDYRVDFNIVHCD